MWDTKHRVVIITENQQISDFTKINIITIWIFRGYYYLCIESFMSGQFSGKMQHFQC